MLMFSMCHISPYYKILQGPQKLKRSNTSRVSFGCVLLWDPNPTLATMLCHFCFNTLMLKVQGGKEVDLFFFSMISVV